MKTQNTNYKKDKQKKDKQKKDKQKKYFFISLTNQSA